MVDTKWNHFSWAPLHIDRILGCLGEQLAKGKQLRSPTWVSLEETQRVGGFLFHGNVGTVG